MYGGSYGGVVNPGYFVVYERSPDQILRVSGILIYFILGNI